MTVDLVFSRAPLAQPANLLFGEVDILADSLVTVSVGLPALRLTARIGPYYTASVVAMIGGPTFQCHATYTSGTQRPTVARTIAVHQVASHGEGGSASTFQQSLAVEPGAGTRWGRGTATGSEVKDRITSPFVRVRAGHLQRFADAVGVLTWPMWQGHQDGLRDRRATAREAFGDAAQLAGGFIGDHWREMLRDRRNRSEGRFASAERLSVRRQDSQQRAHPFFMQDRARHREAIRPPAGTSAIVIPPPVFDPCYLPDPNLLFSEGWSAAPNLLFICERHITPPPGATVVVPVKRVYMVINNVELRRVDGNISLPCFTMSLSIDADSWTWGFNATVPASLLANLAPSVAGEPVELEATINGTAYRIYAERISRSREFKSMPTLSLSGRGRSAVLDAPYSPIFNFGNDTDRTAQQLMDDVLLDNGVPLGWTIDWQLTDWLVPAGVFSQQGSRMNALLAIAGAAGGYIQPHPSMDVLHVLHRYPVAPWDWAAATPDFELPDALTTRESIEWIEKARYNRVFVSGTKAGVLAQVTRQGTAGDVLAQMVTDALITEAAAGRQRGIAVLGDTGRQATVGLRLPVLAETGIITPGKMVRYVEGSTPRVGIVRSTRVGVGLPEVWQELAVETHE